MSKDKSAHRVRLATLYRDLEVSLAALRRDPSRVVASRAIVERALADHVESAEGEREPHAYYGINTGFGILANQRIPREDLARLQQNLVLSHAVGLGQPVPRAISRLMLQLKIHSLGLGLSGVSMATFAALLALEEHDLVPYVPSKGSLGASGDLAPLAHMSLPLLGHGTFHLPDGSKQHAMEGLTAHGLAPVELEAKDGLALLNGTQMMAAYGAWALHRSVQITKTADILAAMSLEAMRGSAKPFDERIQAARPHPGQRTVAANVRHLLEDSEILESHRLCGKVQDPYSLRCVPQVHGATRDALAWAGEVVERELNSATDNPLVFGDGEILSGGNFHGQPLAYALDFGGHSPRGAGEHFGASHLPAARRPR